MKKNKISKDWLIKQKKDNFFKQSKIQGYRARSAFKLIEMDKKFKIISKETNFLDLGSSPGSWSQVAAKKITKGKILAIDINYMKPIDNVKFLQRDINESEIKYEITNYFGTKLEVVVSDMAAKTTGNKDLDSYRTGELCLKAMNIAFDSLNTNGIFLAKVFMGSIFTEINKKANECFKKVVKYKPLSSRKESKEIYIYCKGIKKI